MAGENGSMLTCAKKGLETYLLFLCDISVKEVALALAEMWHAAWPLATSAKGTVRLDQISRQVIPLDRLGIGHQLLFLYLSKLSLLIVVQKNFTA
jgi:hypothetical protein